MRNFNCKHYSSCLMDAAIKDIRTLPCDDCSRVELIELEHFDTLNFEEILACAKLINCIFFQS